MKSEHAIATIAADLAPGEHLLAHVSTALTGRHSQSVRGALALTDTRVRFVGSLMRQHEDVSVPLAAITDVGNYRQGMLAFTTLAADGITYKFLELPGGFLDRLKDARTAVGGADAVEAGEPSERLDEPAAPLSSANEPPLADQLAQLTELHRTGALTAEEFSVAKARVLGLDR